MLSANDAQRFTLVRQLDSTLRWLDSPVSNGTNPDLLIQPVSQLFWVQKEAS